VNELTSTTGIVALAAGGLALVAIACAVVLAIKLRRLRVSQRAVLGTSGRDDLIAHAERLDRQFAELTNYVNDAAERLDARMTTGERRLDGALAHRAVVRYDAYNEMSGQQSSSIALLDSHRSGVVLSSILHRDHARLYAKPVVEGQGILDLSPEEKQAIDEALAAGGVRPVASEAGGGR
jgi:Protein of unknown function (DUF4446)